MRKILATAATAALLATGATWVMAADQVITINAEVDGFCTTANEANTTVTIGTNSSGGLSGTNTANPTLDVTCNKASNVSLTTKNGAVTLDNLAQSPPPFGFANAIEYKASVNGGAGLVELDTTVPPLTKSGAFSNVAVAALNTTVTIVPTAPSDPLLAGSYSDQLTVEILPTP